MDLPPEDSISCHHKNSLFDLDLLHYPTIPASDLPSTKVIRNPAHSDFGTLTLLFQDSTGGLEVLDPDSTDDITSAGAERTGKLMHVDPVPGAIVVNVGYLLMRWSNGRWRNAIHRVSEPSDQYSQSSQDKGSNPDTTEDSTKVIPERYSIGVFSSPDYDTMVEALPGCVTEQNPSKWRPLNVGEYMRRKRTAMFG